MRRINRRLVLLSIVLVCDVVSVFGRPQEQSTATNQLKDDLVNRYTTFTSASPRSLETIKNYLSTSKNQYASNVTDQKKEDTRYAEPDPSLRPFFQFLLNSSKRKKRNLFRSSDRRLVENFINYSINDLQKPMQSDSSLDPYVLVHETGETAYTQHGHEPSETQYLPVPIYTNIPKLKPAGYGSDSSSTLYQSSTSDSYKYWQETPLIFPNGNRKPPVVTRPTVISSHYYPTEYGHLDLVNHDQPVPPTFVTPIELQAPTFITPVEYQGPTFVTPISVTHTPSPAPTIVILEDMDTEIENTPQSDPAVQQDAGAVGGAGGGSSALGAVAAAGAGIASLIGAGAGAGIAGIAGGGAAAATATSGTPGTGGMVGQETSSTIPAAPADVVQCRAASGSASKVCSELITASSEVSSSSSSSFLDFMITLLTSLNFLGPITLAFWSMLFPPMSIILASGLGVISFLFPWLLPRVWFGRQLSQTFNSDPYNRRFDDFNIYHRPYY